MKSEIDRVKGYKFEVEEGIVMKITVMTHSPSLHTILISHHHIALDGLAWSLFMADLSQAYAGRLSTMSPTSSIQQSIDIAKRQLDLFNPEYLHADLFLGENLQNHAGDSPSFPIREGEDSSYHKDYHNDIFNFNFPTNLHKLVEMVAAKVGVTTFNFYLATLVTFLSRCLAFGTLV